MKTRSGSLLVLVLAALLLLPATAGAAQTLVVGGPGAADSGNCVLAPCATIGYAISQAADGDTVDIGAAHYEEQLTVEKRLTLQGDLAGGTEIGPLSLAGVVAGSAITLGPGSDGTVIRDLDLRSAAQYQPTIATTGGEIDDVTIEGVRQTGIGPSTPPTTVAPGLEISVPGDGWEVLDSTFEGDYHGILVSGDSSDLMVEGDVFPHDRTGFYVQRSTPLGPTSKGTVEGLRLAHCVFVEDEYRGLYFEGLSEATIEDILVAGTGAGFSSPPFGAAGLSLNLKAGDYGHIKIADARISGSLHEGITIQVRGYPGDTPYEGAGAASLQSVEVTDSTLVGNGGPGIAITNEANLGLAKVTDSRIVDDGTADLITGGAASSDGIFALDKLPGAPTVEAADNWFGCNGGPGATGCSDVDPQAAAEPWLVLGASAAAPSLTSGSATALRAAIDTDSDGLAAGPAPDGTPVSFAAADGSVTPSATALLGGTSAATYTAGAPGDAGLTATVDGQSIAIPLTVQAPPAEPGHDGGTPPQAAPPAPPPVTIEPTAAKAPKVVAASGAVTVATVGCATSHCEVEATKPAITIGGRSFKVRVKVPATVAGGGSAPVRVILPRKAREALEEKGKGTVKVRVTVTAADGTTKTVTVTLVVKAKHHAKSGGS